MEIKLTNCYKVVITEYERDWESKIDEVKYFDNEPEARKFVSDFNSKNTSDVVPDWYMAASYEGKVQ